jgi:hypothetical protein
MFPKMICCAPPAVADAVQTVSAEATYAQGWHEYPEAVWTHKSIVPEVPLPRTPSDAVDVTLVNTPPWKITEACEAVTSGICTRSAVFVESGARP